MKKNLTVLPADTYTVINKSIITSYDKQIITMLYQPIIGYQAVSLYLTLLNDLDKKEFMSEEFTHHHLMATMELKLEEIVNARLKLEAIGLLKSYIKEINGINCYAYLIYSPLSINDFFNHPILNVVLYNNLGKKEYEKLLNYYKIPRVSLKDYTDITSSFNEVFSSVPGKSIEIEDIIKKASNTIEIEGSLDFDMIISGIPKSMLNEKCFSKEVKQLINSLAFTYNIKEEIMQALVRDSLNEKGLIDKTTLRKSCRNYYQFDNAGKLPTLVYRTQPEYLKKPVGDTSKWAKMVYTFENISPYDFLRVKYKGAEPTTRDLRLIENLLIDQELNPGVVNVLLDYVLKINNQKLNKSYIETIVGQWKRLNIETVEDAMKEAEKEHKKLKNKFSNSNNKSTAKIVNNKENVPVWFDKNVNNTETTKEEQEELDKILNSIA